MSGLGELDVSETEVVGEKAVSEVDAACSKDWVIVVSLDVAIVVEASESESEDVALSSISG